jgi:hypothetical protein
MEGGYAVKNLGANVAEFLTLLKVAVAVRQP